MAIAQDHDADERPNQEKAHRESRGNQCKRHGIDSDLREWRTPCTLVSALHALLSGIGDWQG
jgi:hypothetical protein